MKTFESLSMSRRNRLGIPRLSIRPRPEVDESALGYLIRASIANGYAQPKTLWRLLRNNGWSGLRLLRSALRLPRHRADSLVGPFPAYVEIQYKTDHALHVDDFNHRYLRWCPKCLRDAAYVRGEWSIKLSCVCSLHDVELMDRCSRCHELQDIGVGIFTCQHCLADLGGTNATSATDELIILQARLLKAVAGETSGKQGELTFHQLSLLTKQLGQFGSDMPKRRSGQIAGLDRLDVAMTLMSRAANLLSDWPFNFHRALTEVRTKSVSSASLKRTFGSLYRAIYVDLHEPSFQFLRDAFDEYVRTEWPHLIAKRNRRLNPKTVAYRARRPLEMLSRETGVSRTSLKRLASSGLIVGSPVKHTSGRTTWAFPKSAIKKVKAIANDTINLQHSAKLLGISKHRVQELIEAGLVRAWIRAGTMRASAWSLCKQDVLCLLRLCGSCSKTSGEGVKRVSLRRVMQTWRLREGELPALLQGCKSGALSTHRSQTIGSSLSDLSFDVEALRAWLEVYRCKNCDRTFSVDQTAKMLGIKQQVAYELVRTGLLMTVSTGDPALRGARISIKAISDFNESFVSLSDLSKVNGCRPRTLLSQISARPVTGPNIDGSRQYFYKRSEVAIFLKTKRCSRVNASDVNCVGNFLRHTLPLPGDEAA